MNFSKLRSMTLLALAAGAAYLTPAAQAVPAAAADGDLILGVRASSGAGATTDYVLDLGSAATIAGNSSATTVKTIGTDLNALFGLGSNSWSTSSTVFWGVVGTTGDFNAVGSDPAKTVWATRPRPSGGILATPWARQSSSTQGVTAGKIEGMRSAYDSGTVAGSVSNSVEQALATVTNNWASYQPGGTLANSGPAPGVSFAAFNPTIEGNPGDVLDLFEMQPGSGSGVFQGSFTLSSAGVVTFTPASVEASVVSIASSTYSVGETAGSVTVTLSRPTSVGPASVLLSTSDGTALAGTDYAAQSSVEVDFAPGAATATATIPVTNRAGAGSDGRSFTATIVANSGITTIGATASTTISISNSPAGVVDFDSASYSVVSGNVTLHLVRSGGTAATTVTVTSSNTALVANPSSAVSFALGVNTATVVLPVSVSTSFIATTVTFTIGTGAGVTHPTATTSVVGLDTAPPVIAVTVPVAAAATVTGATSPGNLLVSATVSDNVGIASVKVGINGTFTDITSQASAGATSTSKTFALVSVSGLIAGYNTVDVQAIDTNGNVSDVVRLVKYTSNVVATANINLAGTTVVAPAASTTLLTTIAATTKWTIGTSYTITAAQFSDSTGAKTLTPSDSSFTFSSWTVPGIGTVTTPALTFVMSAAIANTPITANYVATPFKAAAAGNYDGLVTVRSGFTGSNHTYGFLHVVLTSKGSFTGKLQIDGISTTAGTLTGSLDNSGVAHFGTALNSFLSIARTSEANLILSFSIDLTGHTLTGVAYDGTNLSDISANQATTTPASAYLGRIFNFVLPPDASKTPTTSFPQGYSVGNIAISSTTGAVTGAVKLADGSVGTVSSTFVAPVTGGSTYTVPLYVPLYGAGTAASPYTGSISGLATLDNSQTNTDISATTLHWFKPTGGTLYATGWPTGASVALNGTIYTGSATSAPIAGLGPVTTPATTTHGNAKAIFFAPATVTSPVTLNVTKTLNISTAFAFANAPTDTTFALTPTAASGYFTVKYNGSTVVNGNGIILQKGANVGGFGYWTNTVDSSEVTLTKD